MSDFNPVVLSACEKMKNKHRPCECFFYGDEQKNLPCKLVRQFPGIHNMLDLFSVLEPCWSKETAYPSCQTEWVRSDPSYGQCAITAMLAHDMFGWSIHKIRNENGVTHYFNKPNGKYVDLTQKQFDLYDLPVGYEPNQEISREYCGRNKNTLLRYRYLQRNIMHYLQPNENSQ